MARLLEKRRIASAVAAAARPAARPKLAACLALRVQLAEPPNHEDLLPILRYPVLVPEVAGDPLCSARFLGGSVQREECASGVMQCADGLSTLAAESNEEEALVCVEAQGRGRVVAGAKSGKRGAGRVALGTVSFVCGHVCIGKYKNFNIRRGRLVQYLRAQQ